MPDETKVRGRWDYRTGVPGLVRDNNNGNYYARSQVSGKRTMKSLKTSVWSVAKLRMTDHQSGAERQRRRERRVTGGEITMGDLIDRHQKEYLADTSKSKSSRTNIVSTTNRLVDHWRACFGSDLREQRPGRIAVDQVRRFSNYLHQEATFLSYKAKTRKKGFKSVTVNKTIELLHRVLRIAAEDGIIIGVPFELEPASGPPVRKPEPRKKLQLPPAHKMREIFKHMREAGTHMPRDADPALADYLHRRAQESADFAEFMAYTGARKSEAASFDWEDNLGTFIYIRGTKTEGSKDRMVPKIPAIRVLLKRMLARRKKEGRPTAKGRAFNIRQCAQALTTACQKAGVQRLTHHSLRHYFATICIESGVDIPTISRWLGHVDGGVLAMQTYGHLRIEHSVASAKKVAA